MSYMNKRMSYTLRVPTDVMEAIDALTRERGCSRAEVVIEAMREKTERINHGTANSTTGAGRSEEGKAGGSGNGTTLPVLREAKSQAKRLHPMQSVRDELAGRREPVAGPKGQPHADHRTMPYGEKHWCSDCRVYY
jgi:predicted transcriptional regulator